MGAAPSGDAIAVEPEPLHRTIPASADAIAPLRHELRAFAEQAGAADPWAVALAISETVANAVLHAYVGAGEPGEIVVDAACVDGNGIRPTVADTGSGMTPRPDSPGIGVGLPLVAHLADRFEIRDRPEGGTLVSMVFAVAG